MRDVSLILTNGNFMVVRKLFASGKANLLNFSACKEVFNTGAAKLADEETRTTADHGLANFRITNIHTLCQDFSFLPLVAVAENLKNRPIPAHQRGAVQAQAIDILDGRMPAMPSNQAWGPISSA
jgi:ABC-type lipoprotein export system ATPase subunit